MYQPWDHNFTYPGFLYMSFMLLLRRGSAMKIGTGHKRYIDIIIKKHMYRAHVIYEKYK